MWLSGITIRRPISLLLLAN